MGVIKSILKICAFLVLSAIAIAIVYRIVDPPLTPLMVIRPMERLGDGQLVGIRKDWVSIDNVSPHLLRSVIAAEDGRFLTHNGVDWRAVEQARKRNERIEKRGGSKLYGASTITMQCARNVFLWQGRNYIRKGLEVGFTYLVEVVWGKRRILEVYLNVVEWGDGIYGAESASQKYFGIPASQLSARQAALLAAVLPNPRLWDPAHPTSYIRKRAHAIMARARGVGLGTLVSTKQSTRSNQKK